ncbi:haloacid dehalogenase [Oribacterium sp. C9]|uniref:Cof-type HAD-IIB family hydrolase n=1 Tax=Oribacterium sp. C9 TaxID=1943579 RepID=UPI00098F32E5|nr:Cof-type HAD-IIB family hydrolase [Oribacterium sp. C9]OON88246.1 haloacid dehalogenase [Oribacterium sp. C9]
MIKIIFFDIDGTLRPFETGTIPKSTQEAVKKAHDAGIITAIATGRHWMEIKNENLIEGMRFDAFVTLDGEYCYVLDRDVVDEAVEHHEHLLHHKEFIFDSSQAKKPICYFDPLNGTCVQKIEIPPYDVKTVLDICNQNSFSCLFEEERLIYANVITDDLMEVLHDIKSAEPPVMDTSRALYNPVFMLIPVMNLEESKKLEDQIPDCQLVRWSDGLSFDLTKKGITKVSGIDAILKHYGFSLSECAAIGDGWNDVDMLKHCGLGIAMGNAKQECKDVADYICPHILDNGINDAVDFIINYN